MRRLSIYLLSLSLVLLFAGNLRAWDAPHGTGGIKGVWTKDANKNVDCATSCHVPKEAQATGPMLTIRATNPELCMQCHISGSLAAGNLPFDPNDQANHTNKTGTSHRWDISMNAGVAPLNLASNNPNNKYGLKTYETLPTETLSSSSLKSKHLLFGAVTCSTCHNQHYQAAASPWDPASGLYKSTGAAAGSTNKIIVQTGAGWAENQWGGCSDPLYTDEAACEGAGKTWIDNFYVRITSGSNKGNIRLIKTNTADTLEIYATLLSTDPDARRRTFNVAITAGNTYIITSAENHFMRAENKAGEMCEYCHYYRTPDSQPAGISQTNVETCNPNSGDGNRCYKMSHPIRKNLTTDVANADQFVGAAPLEPLSVFDAAGDIAAQTGLPRYHQNGTGDSNSDNNIVLDSNSKVRCMSCHGMHYKDSE